MIYKKDYTFMMSERLPEGESGDWTLKKFTLSKGATVKTYTIGGFFYYDTLNTDFPIVKLSYQGGTVMTDGPGEQEGFRIPVMQAYGNVLVIGLGIGLLPSLLGIHNRRTNHILIIEKSQDVVKLVYPHIFPYIKSRKVGLVIQDGEEYLRTCTEKFDFVFVDIWADIVAPMQEIDKWTEMAKPHLNPNGDVRCWLQELYNRIKLKLPKEPLVSSGILAFEEPCLICGKVLRTDYAGLCMDCADLLGVSEMFIESKR